MLSRVRERVQELMEPLGRAFARTGLPPNAFTLIGLVVGVAAALLFAYGMQLWAGFAILVCGFFDIIDGAVARVTGRVTAFGGVLDSVVDRYVDFLIFVGIIYGGLAEAGFLPGWAWGILAITGCLMVSYVRSRAEAAGSGKLDVGVAERAERILILATGALIGHTQHAVVLIVILTHLTVVQRLFAAKLRLL
jgi:archaetidylinositol phosphate synthase